MTDKLPINNRVNMRFIFFMIIFLFPSFLVAQEVEVGKTETFKLIAIRDRDGMQGSFFLGSGYIESYPAYIYYYQLSNGAYQLANIRADNTNVFIYEEKREDAVLIKTAHFCGAWRCYSDKWEFHIPVGSIKRGFKL